MPLDVRCPSCSSAIHTWSKLSVWSNVVVRIVEGLRREVAPRGEAQLAVRTRGARNVIIRLVF
ncbi:hypothetical protein BDU57DRAFT_509102 [Ampelomyces quisqualis]|uniref:Uncharacterized protein n=1 Tax=Ampelomyces quisqualis TaxID=50730 RepID=A0A6A5R3Z7_AMPQU|nr:hypothetical protein BDU57DRAFT_509102 [Ampelomyces quisqualis]